MSDEELKKTLAKIAKVVDPFTVVINIGSIHGIEDGQKFLIFGESDEEIKDPDTGEILGNIPIPKGEGVAVLVDEKMTTIKSIEREPPKAPGQLIPLSAFAGVTYFPGEEKPFNNPKRGDRVKLIK